MTTTLASLIEAKILEIGDGYRAKNDELGGDGLIFLRSGHVSDRGIDFSGVERFRCKDESKFRGKVAAPGDVIVTTKGWSTGRVSFVDAAMPRFVYSPHLSYWRSLDPNRVYPAYLRQWSRSPECQRQLNSIKMGIDIHPYLSLETQRGLAITLPAIGLQRAIASILGALDYRIELNRRTNETLEELARTIFKSWFVDFDAVRAKVEGRQPEGMDAQTAALFPSRLVDSELGMIPEGWKVQALGTFASLDKGLSYKGEFLSKKGRPLVNLGNFARSGEFVSDKMKYYVGEYQARHVVLPGDLVLANTDITQRRDVIGSPAIIPDNLGAPILFTHHVYAVRFTSSEHEWPLLGYFWLVQESFRERARGFATGTTVLGLPRDTVLEHNVVVPSHNVRLALTEAIRPLLAKARRNEVESATLSALRDSLLPKLISGELRIPDAEELAEAVL
jgi:type I restriction enzyme S subunit